MKLAQMAGTGMVAGVGRAQRLAVRVRARVLVRVLVLLAAGACRARGLGTLELVLEAGTDTDAKSGRVRQFAVWMYGLVQVDVAVAVAGRTGSCL